MNKATFLRWSALVLWLVVLSAVVIAWLFSDLSLQEISTSVEQWMHQVGFLPSILLFLLASILRPFVLFPATVLTTLAGTLFGPWIGAIIALAGDLLGANMAFLVARFIGGDWMEKWISVRKWNEKLKEHGVIAVLLMRLLFLPFDLVNFGCGLTSMRQRDFALGTLLGVIPGLLIFTLLGGAGMSDAKQEVQILEWSMPQWTIYLVLSLALFLLSLLGSWLLKSMSGKARGIAKTIKK